MTTTSRLLLRLTSRASEPVCSSCSRRAPIQAGRHTYHSLRMMVVPGWFLRRSCPNRSMSLSSSSGRAKPSLPNAIRPIQSLLFSPGNSSLANSIRKTNHRKLALSLTASSQFYQRGPQVPKVRFWPDRVGTQFGATAPCFPQWRSCWQEPLFLSFRFAGHGALHRGRGMEGILHVRPTGL
jgi:hypothetical protein